MATELQPEVNQQDAGYDARDEEHRKTRLKPGTGR
jgi:hypothetical protein